MTSFSTTIKAACGRGRLRARLASLAVLAGRHRERQRQELVDDQLEECEGYG